VPNSYVIDYLEQYIIRLFLRQISKKKKKTNCGVIGQLVTFKSFTKGFSELQLTGGLFVGYSAT